MTTSIKSFHHRKDAVRFANVKRRAAQRLANKAEAMTRAGRYRAGAELVNEAISMFISMLYEVDRDIRTLANVDSVDGRILPPVPWGRRYREYGLRGPEAETLRGHMLKLDKLDKAGKLQSPTLLRWDDESRRWRLNIADYPSRAAALDWWTRNEVDALHFHRSMQAIKRRQARYKARY